MITYQHILRSFNGNLPLTLKTLKDWCNVEDIEYLPRPGTLLHHGESRVKVRTDMVIAPEALVNGYWQPEETRFGKMVLHNVNEYTLVDIGANIGLFTRQFMTSVPRCSRAFCYEPNDSNFRILKYNTRPWEHISHFKVALSNCNEESTLYEESDNSGNYSLNRKAIEAGNEFSTSSVHLRDVEDECKKWCEKDSPIFYKSDTQGHEESIICSIPTDFWKNVQGGIIEIFRVEKADWDRDKFFLFLENFPNLVLLDNPGRVLTASEVMGILLGKSDRLNKDLGFWK